MTIWEQAIDDIFNVPELKEYAYFEGKKITVFSYDVSTDTQYTEYGFDEGVSFYLTCKKSDYVPVRGDKCKFRGEQYKVSNFTLDSYGLTYKIYLKSLSSK